MMSTTSVRGRDLEGVDRDHEVDRAGLVGVVLDLEVAAHQRVHRRGELLAGHHQRGEAGGAGRRLVERPCGRPSGRTAARARTPPRPDRATGEDHSRCEVGSMVGVEMSPNESSSTRSPSPVASRVKPSEQVPRKPKVSQPRDRRQASRRPLSQITRTWSLGALSSVAARGGDDRVGVLPVGDDRRLLGQRERVALVVRARRSRSSCGCCRRCRSRWWPRRAAAARRRPGGCSPAPSRSGRAGRSRRPGCGASPGSSPRTRSSGRPRGPPRPPGAGRGRGRRARSGPAPRAGPRRGRRRRSPWGSARWRRRRRRGSPRSRGRSGGASSTISRTPSCSSASFIRRHRRRRSMSELGRAPRAIAATEAKVLFFSICCGNSMSHSSSQASITVTDACEVIPAA